MSARKNRQSSLRNQSLRVESLERREMLNADNVFASVTLETNFGDIEFRLRHDTAPGTVDNFINYIQDDDYINGIFHRLVPGFVLQGGGFRSSAEQICSQAECNASNVSADLFDSVPTDPPIQNEFEISNTRGTVAMAKLGNDPNSATSQFFVNLVDNATNLDNQNGGFTVFAEVVDMTVVDELAEFSTINLSALVPAIGAAAVSGNQIVRMEGFRSTDVITGSVFLDANNDSVRGPREQGIAGRIVYVDANNDGVRDSREQTATTDSAGNYALFVENGDYIIRVEEPTGFDQTLQSERIDVTTDFARITQDVNFGLRYIGDSWTNPLIETDVDAVNGVNPTDVITVVNELILRDFSDSETGALPSTNDNDGPLRFFDVDGNGFVSPQDAIGIINDIVRGTPAGLRESASETPADVGSALDASSIASPVTDSSPVIAAPNVALNSIQQNARQSYSSENLSADSISAGRDAEAVDHVFGAIGSL